MKWDKTANMVLLFIFLGFLSLYFFPPVIRYDMPPDTEDISVMYAIYGLVYAALWIALIVYSAWKRRRHFLIGSLFFGILIYLPERVLPHFITDPTEEANLLAESMNWFFRWLYSLVYAAQGGLSRYIGAATVVDWTRKIVPAFWIIYLGTQIIRYYRNAYLAQMLQMEKTVRHENPDLAREIGTVAESGKKRLVSKFPLEMMSEMESGMPTVYRPKDDEEEDFLELTMPVPAAHEPLDIPSSDDE